MKTNKMLSIILIVGGLVLLILGIHQFVEFQQSFGGRAAALGNRISSALGGSTSVAKGYVQPIIMIVAGAVAAVAGFFMSKKR